MKRVVSYLLVVSLLFAVGCRKEPQDQSKEQLNGTITMSGAWALYPMVVKWAEEFGKIHPQVKIDVAAGGAGKGMADCLAQVVDIGMVSRDIYMAEIEKGAWWVSVTKDAVVPTVNKNNPALNEILKKGIKREAFVNIWITGKIKNWGQITGSDTTDAIHVYTRSDACGAAKTWAKFLGKNQEDLLGVGLYGDPGLAEAVKKDVLGIGFNNINYAYDSKTKIEIEQIKVLPIDLNGNGLIDENEDFYNSRDKIVEAIATGKYPSPPARPLHLVSQGRPKSKVVLEFIKWILTDGQKYIPESGYINLNEEKIAEELKKLEGNE
jgi:phosphate transport system substrate-binding protein